MAAKTDSPSTIVREFLTAGAIYTLIIGIVYLSYLTIRPFVVIILASFAFSLFLTPLHRKITRFLNGRTHLAALAAILIFLLLILVPAFLFINALFHEATTLLNFIQQRGTIADQVEEEMQRLGQQYGILVPQTAIDIQGLIVNLLSRVFEQTGAIIARVGGVVFKMFLILLTTFYLLIGGQDKLFEQLAQLTPLKKRYHHSLQKRALEVLGATLRGNVMIIVIQGFVATIGLTIFGVGPALLLGSLYGLLAVLPALGALLVWMPVAIYFLLAGEGVKALGVAVWFLVTNLTVDNYVMPKIIGGRGKLHPILVLFSILGGIQAFGLIGVIIGPTIIALALTALGIYSEIIRERGLAA